ncbi:MAG: methylmalonyl-CoA mutase family protein [Schleiferiaceae bacterium]|nr:methylmalonyl-CoA mutase family protein [Schleiferiaceae bacterium]
MTDTNDRAYPHGKRVAPLYTEAPDQQPGFRSNPWWVMVQEHAVVKEFAANDWALQRLKHGASGLLFYLYDHQYLPRILRDIDLRYIQLGLVVEGSGPEVMEALLHHAHNEILPLDRINGFINIDPIEIAARTGYWDENKMYDLGELSRLAPPQFKFMCVNANFYGACGASAETQLGLALAHLDFYLEAFGEVGLAQYWLALTAGTHLFEEMAKIRAMRLLWGRLLETYGLPQVHLEIYAETSIQHQSALDVETNLLRASSAAFGAITGGADALQIRPYTAVLGSDDAEAERLALNQQYLFAYESFLDRVEDPAAGSYFIETLTQELCESAWAIAQEVRAMGGILEALQSNWIQDKIWTEANKAAPAHYLGVNKFPAATGFKEGFKPKAPVDRAAHQKKFVDCQIEPLRPIRWAAALENEYGRQA